MNEGENYTNFVRLLSPVRDVEEIAAGAGVRVAKRLMEQYGGSRWRKLKGWATIETMFGDIIEVEVHWYEAHGVGRRDFKAKFTP